MKVFLLLSFSVLSHHRTSGSAYGSSSFTIPMRSNPLSIDILHDTGCNYLLPACSPTFQIDAAGNQELLQYYGISAQGNIFYTLVYKQNGIEKYFQKVLANRLKTCTFAADFTKTHKM